LKLPANGPILEGVDKQRLAESHGARWTRADDYVAALARKRSARRGRSARLGEADPPRSLLGAVPFLALIVLLGVLAAAIMVLAFPGSQPQHQSGRPDTHELGVANRGWFQEAQRQFR